VIRKEKTGSDGNGEGKKVTKRERHKRRYQSRKTIIWSAIVRGETQCTIERRKNGKLRRSDISNEEDVFYEGEGSVQAAEASNGRALKGGGRE